MSDRFVQPEVRHIPEFQAGDTTKWLELKRAYLVQRIPAIIVRGLPELSRQSIFDLGGVEKYSSSETPAAINYDYRDERGLTQEEDLGLHFDRGKVSQSRATTNRVEIGEIGVTLIEGTPDFTDTWGTDYKRYPVIPEEAMEAYSEGLIDTTVFIPVVHNGKASPSDALFSRNMGGLVLAHDITTLTTSRLSFIQSVTLLD